MKNVFVKASRITLILFALAIAILILYIVITNGDEIIELPTVLGLFVFGAIFATAITVLIAVIIDIVESYKKEGFSFLKKYIMEIVFTGLTFTLYEYFIGKSGETWIQCFAQATIIVCAIKAGSNVIFAKNDKEGNRLNVY